MPLPILKPKALRPGSTIGIFTPSTPAYEINPGLFENGIATLERMGFRVKLGSLTKARRSQGYRSAPAPERAQEFMELIEDPEVDGLLSTIGGMNSASLIPFLDFAKIRSAQKLICGYSDITSLHLAILKFAGLRTLYGPGLMCWFGEWPSGIPESEVWFLQAAMLHKEGERPVLPPGRWSNHRRSWANDDWKNLPREWNAHQGWMIGNPGQATAPILALNFNTMMASAGTPYWPELEGKILLLEDMAAPQSRTERNLRQLSAIGAFDKIKGLIVGRPEEYMAEGAPFSYEDLFMEMVGARPYPIVFNFDCSHCVPMISVPQLSPVKLRAEAGLPVEFRFLDGAVE